MPQDGKGPRDAEVARAGAGAGVGKGTLSQWLTPACPLRCGHCLFNVTFVPRNARGFIELQHVVAGRSCGAWFRMRTTWPISSRVLSGGNGVHACAGPHAPLCKSCPAASVPVPAEPVAAVAE